MRSYYFKRKRNVGVRRNVRGHGASTKTVSAAFKCVVGNVCVRTRCAMPARRARFSSSFNAEVRTSQAVKAVFEGRLRVQVSASGAGAIINHCLLEWSSQLCEALTASILDFKPSLSGSSVVRERWQYRPL